MPCKLCVALFKELCYTHGREKPVLCEIYEDYVTERVVGETPLHYAIEVAGWDNFLKARRRLEEQGILPKRR